MTENNKTQDKRYWRVWGPLLLALIILLTLIVYFSRSPAPISPDYSVSPNVAKPKNGTERRFEEIEYKLQDLEERLISQQKKTKTQSDPTQLLHRVLDQLRHIPQMQMKFAALYQAIEMGRPFDKEYEQVQPFIPKNANHKEQIKDFVKLAHLGVKSYSQLKTSFQKASEVLLFQPPTQANWIGKAAAFIKSLFAIRPQPRLITNPQTPVDFVLSIETLLEQQDLKGIQDLLKRSEHIKDPHYLQWRKDFQAYCFARDVYHLLLEQAYTLDIEEK